MVYNRLGTSPKLTFIGYLNSKLFTSNSTTNTESSDLNCSNVRQVSSSVLSISKIPGAVTADNLVTIIFKEQDVKIKDI